MTRIFVPSKGATDWQALLAEPERQWRTGFSAKALAKCWEQAVGFPASVLAAFTASKLPVFKGIDLLLALPEYRVPLPGGRRASQTDLFVLAKSGDDLVSIAVEGKVAEPFGPTVAEWIEQRSAEEERRGGNRAPSAGAQARLDYLLTLVGLSRDEALDLRYQLFHRTASALIEARRFNAAHALMLVHSFSQSNPLASWGDFEQFAARLNCANAKAGTISFVGQRDGIGLYLGWAQGEARFLTE